MPHEIHLHAQWPAWSCRHSLRSQLMTRRIWPPENETDEAIYEHMNAHYISLILKTAKINKGTWTYSEPACFHWRWSCSALRRRRVAAHGCRSSRSCPVGTTRSPGGTRSRPPPTSWSPPQTRGKASWITLTTAEIWRLVQNLVSHHNRKQENFSKDIIKDHKDVYFNYLDLGDDDDGGQPGGDGLLLLHRLSLYVTQASFPLVFRAPPPSSARIPPGLSRSRRMGGPVQIKRAFSTLAYCQFCLAQGSYRMDLSLFFCSCGFFLFWKLYSPI